MARIPWARDHSTPSSLVFHGRSAGPEQLPLPIFTTSVAARIYPWAVKINLAEELLLLAYDDAGSLKISGQSLDYGLAGALLMELTLAGRVDVADKRVAVIDSRPTGDPVIDGALARIGTERRKPQDWVTRLSKGLRDQYLHRMVDAGVLRRDQHKVLWIFPRTHYPAATGAQAAPETETRQRLLAAVNGGGPVDPRTAALCSLVRAVRLEAVAFPGLPKRQVRERLRAISDASWPADAVRKAIEAVEAAVIAGAIAASAAAVTAS
ncbi:GPP34 family phosphoprotein [Planosporangium flavigriseum]|nr:GPP34 family phosphoprotein [Planosporangium flavigriseum]